MSREPHHTAVPSRTRWHLCLYIAGRTPTADRALANLERILSEHLGDRYTLDVIDLRDTPARAEQDQILAVPTLVRSEPGPPRRVVGDFSDTARVLAGLELGGTR